MSSTNDATGKARVLAVLRRHSVVSSWQLTMESRVLNTTGRISDLRDDGYDIRADRITVDGKPIWQYRLIETPVQLGWLPTSASAADFPRLAADAAAGPTGPLPGVGRGSNRRRLVSAS